MIPRLYSADEAKPRSGTSEAVNPYAFQTNGLGGLGDAISCIVTEERNSTYELEMVYPIDGIHFNDIQNDRLIRCDASETSDEQTFRIYNIEKPLDGKVTIHAEHISYLLTKTPCMPFEATGPVEAFTKIEESVQWNTKTSNFPRFPFTFWTDKTSTPAIKIESPRSVRSILMGEQGSILDACGGGDYEFDNFTVRLHNHRGSDNNVTIRYGKNLMDLKNEDDITSVYTGILPYWSGSLRETQSSTDADGRVVVDSVDTTMYITTASQAAYIAEQAAKGKTITNYLNGATLWSTNEKNFASPMSVVVDMSSNLDLDDYEEPDIEQGIDTNGNVIYEYDSKGNPIYERNDDGSIRKDSDGNPVRMKETDAHYATRKINANKKAEAEYKAYVLKTLTEKSNDYLTDNAGWKPKTNFEVSFIQLWQTEEYKDLAALERVSLGDTVHVYYPKMNITEDVRVIKTVYNVLLDRYDSIELGDSKGSAAGEITGIGSAADAADYALIKSLQDSRSFLQIAIEQATAAIAGGLGGYVVFNRNANGAINEILIMDTPTKETAKDVIRINKAGIGFSDGNGYNGPFQSAWTIDGTFNANFINAGVIKAGLIKAGILKSNKTNTNWDLDTGVLTMYDGAINLGKNGNTYYFTVDNNGNVKISKGSISLGYDSGNKRYNFNVDSNGTMTMYHGAINLGWNTNTKKFNFSVNNNGAMVTSSGTIGPSNTPLNRWIIGGDTSRAWIYSGNKSFLSSTDVGTYIGTDGIEIRGKSGNRTNITKLNTDGIFTTYIQMYDRGVDASTFMYLDTNTWMSNGQYRMNFSRGISTGADGVTSADNVFRNATRFENNTYWGAGTPQFYCDRVIFGESDGTVEFRGHTSGIKRDELDDGSDARLKKDISRLNTEESKDFIMQLKPSSYRWIDEDKRDGRLHHGFIAQDAEPISWDGLVYKDSDGYFQLKRHEIIADLVAVVQDMSKRIDALEERLSKFEPGGSCA